MRGLRLLLRPRCSMCHTQFNTCTLLLLFGIQEALWKLDLARQRAATWGFDMLVPLGRVNRGIQTQPGEVWASTGAASAAAATVSRAVHSAQAAAAAAGAAVAYASVSAAATTTASSGSVLLVAAGGELSAEAEPPGGGWLAAGSASSRPSVQRKVPAFTQHDSSSSPRHASSKSLAPGSPSASKTGDPRRKSGADLMQGDSEARVLSDALVLLAGGDVQLLQQGELLRVIASLYSSKAAADARALRSHSAPLSMWAFVLRQLFGGPGSDGGSSGSNADGVTALAQLLGSAQALAGSSKEVAAFHAALMDSIPYSVAAAAGLAAGGGGSSCGNRAGSARVCSAGSEGCEQHSDSLTPRGTGRGSVTLRGAWGEVSCLRRFEVWYQSWGAVC